MEALFRVTGPQKKYVYNIPDSQSQPLLLTISMLSHFVLKATHAQIFWGEGILLRLAAKIKLLGRTTNFLFWGWPVIVKCYGARLKDEWVAF